MSQNQIQLKFVPDPVEPASTRKGAPNPEPSISDFSNVLIDGALTGIGKLENVGEALKLKLLGTAEQYGPFPLTPGRMARMQMGNPKVFEAINKANDRIMKHILGSYKEIEELNSKDPRQMATAQRQVFIKPPQYRLRKLAAEENPEFSRCGVK